MIRNSVETFSDHPALSWADSTPITYRQLGEEIKGITLLLHKQGIVTGDKVAILGENSPNWGIAYLAVTSMGAVAVPILPDFHPSEIQHILNHSGSKAIFISLKLFHKIEAAIFDQLKTMILIDDFRLIPPETDSEKLKNLLREGERELARWKDSALKLAGFLPSEVEEDSLAAIIYTSGTTGHSKGVMLTHKNLITNTISTLAIQDCSPADRLISILPLSHTYENTLGFLLPIMSGAAIYYLDKPPTSRVLLPAMQKIRPTMMLTVPLIIEKIFKTKIHPTFTHNPVLNFYYKMPPFRKFLHRIAGRKLLKSFGGKLRFFGIGGALLSAEVERFLRDAGFPYAIGYGLTETSPLIAGCSPKLTRYRSTGPVIPGVQVRIDNPDPVSGEGEILVKGDNVMQGYYNNPERTAEVMTENGWFRTGDLGILKKSGYLYIKGRLKNMILGPSGENIYPEEIEAQINENDYILESIVYAEDNKIIARCYLNYELLDVEFKRKHLKDHQAREAIDQLLESVRKEVNEQRAAYSRLSRIIEQTEPFEKTPTKKIKRYLYIPDQ